jgi:hypothetical protein
MKLIGGGKEKEMAHQDNVARPAPTRLEPLKFYLIPY